MPTSLTISELWRYPVKSMQGEQLDRAVIDTDGLLGDRRFALVDDATGFGLTGRRVPELLFASARLVGDQPEITLPDGTIACDDDVLSSWLGRKVRLVDARAVAGNKYESPDDAETERDWHVFEGPGGAFHDAEIFRVSLLSTATIGAWAPRRFRANVMLDGGGEDELVGSDVALGSAVVHVQWGIPRCVMVTRPQPRGIERDLSVLKTIQHDRESCLAIGATVVQPGEVCVGDALG
jgi:uncharacterized protein YcbX